MYEEDPSQRGRVLLGHLSDCQQVRSPALAVLLSMNTIMLRMNSIMLRMNTIILRMNIIMLWFLQEGLKHPPLWADCQDAARL